MSSYLSAGRDKAVEEETEPDDTEEDEEEDDEDEEDDDISAIGDDGIKDGKVDDSCFIWVIGFWGRLYQFIKNKFKRKEKY